jgi:hypothetical protein
MQVVDFLHPEQALARLHPLGLTDDWADKLAGESFTSPNQRVTHEHYSQVGALLRRVSAGCCCTASAPVALRLQIQRRHQYQQHCDLTTPCRILH